MNETSQAELAQPGTKSWEGLNEEADGTDGGKNQRRCGWRQNLRPFHYPCEEWESLNQREYAGKFGSGSGSGNCLKGFGLCEITNERNVRTHSTMILIRRIQGKKIRMCGLSLVAATVIGGDLQFKVPILTQTKHEVGKGFKVNEGKQAKPED